MAESGNSRLEAFCDGVFAIALTLLVIEIKVPPPGSVATTSDVWVALGRLGPSLFSFVLSFVIILITWANHHSLLKLVRGSTPHFIYANGLLLLSVVFIPFPTALLGEYLRTDHAAPAVVLYSGVCGFQSIGWWFLTTSALSPPGLAKTDRSRLAIAKYRQYSYYAVATYTVCAVAAVWYPQTIAVVITLIWIFWLVFGIRVRDEEDR